MIIVFHKDNQVTRVKLTSGEMDDYSTATIAQCLYSLAAKYRNAQIFWCHDDYRENLNTDLSEFVSSDQIMLSYCHGDSSYLGREIGYVEHLPFLTIRKNVVYPTWRMCSAAGMITSNILNQLQTVVKAEKDFDYFINSVSKLCMPLGLRCYSVPDLLIGLHGTPYNYNNSLNILFRFVRQHYKGSWLFLLFINLLVYERRIAILPLLKSLIYRRRHLRSLRVTATRNDKISRNTSIDVLIPTIGRKSYLYDVLSDLRTQSFLPAAVIIIEQNPLPGSTSELSFLNDEFWPFKIKHTFTNQAGACNARNIGLSEIESEWVFFADDDIRFKSDFIEQVFDQVSATGAKAVSINCLHDLEENSAQHIFQWINFGTGCSFVKAENVKHLRFNSAYEFGYGEDSDFGMQLRNSGVDILFIPSPVIHHLRAPIGGFRYRPVFAWDNDVVKPKPSPTVMLYFLTHYSREEILGFKTTLFLKFYGEQKIINPFRYMNLFRKGWNRSIYWAKHISKV